MNELKNEFMPDLVREETLQDLMSAENNESEIFSTVEDKIDVYNAMNDEAVSLKDAINKELIVTGLVIHKSEAVDSETGELINGYRMVFVTDDGLYSTSSKSVFNNVRQLNLFAGVPSKDNPWKITPTLKKGRKFDYLILKLNG